MIVDLERRRARIAAAWNLTDDVVLVGAGHPISIPGAADQLYPFLSHAEYFYLTDRECAGGIVAFDPKDGWTDFVPDVTTAERVWEGKTDTPGTPLSTLDAWLAARSGRRVVTLGVPPANAKGDAARAAELREALTHARRPKDAAEQQRMREAAAATAPGFEVARRMMKPCVTERAIEIELNAEFYRRGGTRTAYETIVASGPNSAVLHFAPTARALEPGDAVLIDAGAEVRRYASDITRTYRVPGGDAGWFRDLYAVVLEVENKAVSRCTPGREWRDVHLEAAVGLTAGLVELGLMRGNPTSLVESDAHFLFFPHGIGHMVGLGVRDAGGFLPGRVRSPRPGLSNLRSDLPLEPGYAMTVEPGIYFIPALLDDPELRAKHRDAIVWDKVEPLKTLGGIRIEDNVIVTDGGPEILTAAVPKELDAMVPA
jgi:Xaa-Pro aminopeptidase